MKPKEGRMERLLRERGFDGAIVSSPESSHYVTGFGGHQHIVSRQPGFTLTAMHSDDRAPTHIITMGLEVATFRIRPAGLGFVVNPYDTWAGLRTWPEIFQGTAFPDKVRMESSADRLERLVKTCDLADKRTGVEMGCLTVPYYNMIHEKFPKTRLVDISDLFMYARSIRAEEKMKMFRELCRIADHGLTQTNRMAGIGVPERETSDCPREDVIWSGLCVPSVRSMLSTGPFGARPTLPEDGIMKDGDVIKFDVGVNAEFDSYTTDTSRAWIIGNEDPALMKLKDRPYEGQRRMTAVARLGLPMNELHHTAYGYVEEMFFCYRRRHQGHSISMDPATTEAPYINATETRPFETGMVLAMEVPCYIDGVSGFNIEDMVLITENECEVLTPCTPYYL